MYEKTRKYTFEQLIDIFCRERENMRDYVAKPLMEVMGTIDGRNLANFFIDLWIEKAKNCKTEDEFDFLLRESLRMSFHDWFNSLS